MTTALRPQLSCLALFLALSLLLPAAAQSAHSPDRGDKAGWPKELTLMSGPSGGEWQELGTTLAHLWSKHIIKTTSRHGGGVSNVINTDTQQGDMGFSTFSVINAAIHSKHDFKDRTIDNTVVLTPLYAMGTYFLMRQDFADKYGIQSVDDMITSNTPVRIATLAPGTASDFLVKKVLEKGFNTSFPKLMESKKWDLEYASFEGGAALLAENHVDCFVFSSGLETPVIQNIEKRLPVVILPLSQRVLDVMAAHCGTTSVEIPAGKYKSARQSLKTVGDFSCIVVRKDLPASLVYELNKSLWGNRNTVTQTVESIKELLPSMPLSPPVPLHPGTSKFWEERL